jgi:hypothetical protein
MAYPLVKAFSHLPEHALEEMIEWLNDYNRPSAVVRAIVRESVKLALQQKMEANQ